MPRECEFILQFKKLRGKGYRMVLCSKIGRQYTVTGGIASLEMSLCDFHRNHLTVEGKTCTELPEVSHQSAIEGPPRPFDNWDER